MEDYSTDRNLPLDLSQSSNISNSKKPCTVTSESGYNENVDWNGNLSQKIDKLIMERNQDKSPAISDSTVTSQGKKSDDSECHVTSCSINQKEKDQVDEDTCNTTSSTLSAPESVATAILVVPVLVTASSSTVQEEKIENISGKSPFLDDLDSESNKRLQISSPVTKKKKSRNSDSKLFLKKRNKTMKPPCRCISGCYNKINYMERLNIFEHFWKLDTRQKQFEFILKYTERYKNKSYTGTNRQFTFKYSLPVISKGKIIRVCKIMYMNTLTLNVHFIKKIWEHFENEQIERNRVINNNINNTTTEDDILVNSVRDHISFLSSLEMEYLGQSPEQLGPNQILNFSLSRMFALYRNWYDPDKYIGRVMSQMQYREIARSNVNIDFDIIKHVDQNKMFENHYKFPKKSHNSINDREESSDKMIVSLESENTDDDDDEPSIEENMTETSPASSSLFLIKINLNLTKPSQGYQRNIKRFQSLQNLDNARTMPVSRVLIEGISIEAPCVCKLKCYDVISYDERINLFNYYRELGNKRMQFEFIVTYTEKSSKKKCISRSLPSYRNYTYKYKLPISLQNKKITVCKQMFLNTLMVNESTVKTAWENFENGLLNQENTEYKKNEDSIKSMNKSVCDHVNSFPPVETHFLGKKANTLYLDGSLNIARMFRSYIQWFDHNKYSHKVENEKKYKEIVDKNFNLDFHVLKKDQCDECQAFRDLKKPNDEQTGRHIMHKENIVTVHNKKNQDQEEAIASNGKIITAIFDIEKVLACPHGNDNRFYNKRKLLCFNFIIFDLSSRYPICYMWDECVAKNEGDDICSCLLQFINVNIENGVEELRFWSDNDESRYYFIFRLYGYIVSKYKVNIYHNFHIKHHIQSEVTNVDHVIEKLASTKNIFTPEEWQSLVKTARTNAQEQFTVVNMTRSNFYKFCENDNSLARQKDNTGNIISWSEVREVFISSENPFEIKFRYNYYEEYKVTDLTKDHKLFDISEKYKEALPLNGNKYKDLMSLCDNGAIPENYTKFYKNLPHENI